MENLDDDSTDRLTFWRNWYAGARPLPDEMRLAWYDAVLDFAFEGKVIENIANPINALMYQAVQMVRSTIEISRKRKANGSKAKAKRSKREANPKQNGANPKQNGANPKQVQEQVQEQEQVCSSATAHARERPTLDQFVEGGRVAGVQEDFARAFYADLVAAGWMDKDGAPVANWRRYLKTAWVEEQKKTAARGSVSAGLDAIRDF